jgi:hypothetical protein
MGDDEPAAVGVQDSFQRDMTANSPNQAAVCKLVECMTL